MVYNGDYLGADARDRDRWCRGAADWESKRGPLCWHSLLHRQRVAVRGVVARAAHMHIGIRVVYVFASSFYFSFRLFMLYTLYIYIEKGYYINSARVCPSALPFGSWRCRPGT